MQAQSRQGLHQLCRCVAGVFVLPQEYVSAKDKDSVRGGVCTILYGTLQRGLCTTTQWDAPLLDSLQTADTYYTHHPYHPLERNAFGSTAQHRRGGASLPANCPYRPHRPHRPHRPSSSVLTDASSVRTRFHRPARRLSSSRPS